MPKCADSFFSGVHSQACWRGPGRWQVSGRNTSSGTPPLDTHLGRGQESSTTGDDDVMAEVKRRKSNCGIIWRWNERATSGPAQQPYSAEVDKIALQRVKLACFPATQFL